MKYKNAVIFVLVVGLITSFITAGFFVSDPAVKTLDMEVKVDFDTIGFNVGTDKIYFGKLKPGVSSYRDVVLTNSDKEPRTVILRSRGTIAGWVTADTNEVLLGPYGNATVTLKVNVPPYAKPGVYTGKMDAVFK